MKDSVKLVANNKRPGMIILLMTKLSAELNYLEQR